jgi:hypothetical protein
MTQGLRGELQAPDIGIGFGRACGALEAGEPERRLLCELFQKFIIEVFEFGDYSNTVFA